MGYVLCKDVNAVLRFEENCTDLPLRPKRVFFFFVSSAQDQKKKEMDQAYS